MRIPIKVEFFAGGVRPIVAFCLRSKQLNLFGFINAIVDTGSPTTILGMADVKKMRISQIQLAKLIGSKREINLGGAQMKTQILSDANITIGNLLNVTLPIQVPIELMEGVPPPSILGVDFLEKAKLKFTFDPANKESYFELNDDYANKN
ncbi:aspartyl protease family protein [Candidatus Pacearchaeota archaeon]|nr:aspartyl protease family protein [Candidatus Pacearchaeota archaeon]